MQRVADDPLGRPLRDLRVSVTDRCNYRCTYCMPFENYEWLEKSKVLTFEEITRLVRLFVQQGVTKVRLTGGEPLLRCDVDRLVAQLAAIEGLDDLCLTTNGDQLVEQAAALKAAGLRRLNVSLDSLDRARFERITRRDRLPQVLAGLEAARAAGFGPIKINMVVERGVNDDEILPMARFCRTQGHALRYIEFMDVGNSNAWDLSRVVTRDEILETLRQEFPLREAPRPHAGDPAERFELEDGTDVGVIASVTRPFCGACTRARLTADGHLVTCLFAAGGTDLKSMLRGGATEAELAAQIAAVWGRRRDEFSRERLGKILSDRGYDPADRDKIEMIRLGG